MARCGQSGFLSGCHLRYSRLIALSLSSCGRVQISSKHLSISLLASSTDAGEDLVDDELAADGLEE